MSYETGQWVRLVSLQGDNKKYNNQIAYINAIDVKEQCRFLDASVYTVQLINQSIKLSLPSCNLNKISDVESGLSPFSAWSQPLCVSTSKPVRSKKKSKKKNNSINQSTAFASFHSEFSIEEILSLNELVLFSEFYMRMFLKNCRRMVSNPASSHRKLCFQYPKKLHSFVESLSSKKSLKSIFNSAMKWEKEGFFEGLSTERKVECLQAVMCALFKGSVSLSDNESNALDDYFTVHGFYLRLATIKIDYTNTQTLSEVFGFDDERRFQCVLEALNLEHRKESLLYFFNKPITVIMTPYVLPDSSLSVMLVGDIKELSKLFASTFKNHLSKYYWNFESVLQGNRCMEYYTFEEVVVMNLVMFDFKILFDPLNERIYDQFIALLNKYPFSLNEESQQLKTAAIQSKCKSDAFHASMSGDSQAWVLNVDLTESMKQPFRMVLNQLGLHGQGNHDALSSYDPRAAEEMSPPCHEDYAAEAVSPASCHDVPDDAESCVSLCVGPPVDAVLLASDVPTPVVSDDLGDMPAVGMEAQDEGVSTGMVARENVDDIAVELNQWLVDHHVINMARRSGLGLFKCLTPEDMALNRLKVTKGDDRSPSAFNTVFAGMMSMNFWLNDKGQRRVNVDTQASANQLHEECVGLLRDQSVLW